MYASVSVIELLPDWYLIERETEKTIEKLNSAGELDYYINNPDEYLRRLAILRLKKLGLKASGEMLKKIMDDPVESHANKYIAAWALKSLLVGLDYDYLSNSRYLAGFTGHESYEELFPVLMEHDVCSVRFQFSSSPYFTTFNINNEDSVLEKDVFFQTDFDIKQWGKDLRASLKSKAKKLLPNIVKLLRKAAKKLLHCIRAAAESLTKLKEKKQANTPKIQAKAYKKHKAMKRGFVKRGIFQLFFFLFYPIRFARKHKFAFLCILVSVYSFFAYFSYGRAITNKYAGFDLQEVQSHLFTKAGELYSQAVNEINRITGINEWKENNGSKQAANDILMTTDINIPKSQGSRDESVSYTVTAKDGLNIRTSPDPSSDKVGSSALPYDTRVTFITSAYSESSGIEWFYVEAEDGRVGWVSSKYLKKAGDQ